MKPAGEDQGEGDSPLHDDSGNTDLKFVAVDLGEETAGGWYRELPDAHIEVLSRAQLERVPLAEADAETKARETIAEILHRRSPSAHDLEKRSDRRSQRLSTRERLLTPDRKPRKLT